MKLNQMAQELGIKVVIDNRPLELLMIAIFVLCLYGLSIYIIVDPYKESKASAGKELGRIDMADIFGKNPIVEVIARAKLVKSGEIKSDDSFMGGYINEENLDKQYFLHFFSTMDRWNFLNTTHNEWQLEIKDDQSSSNMHSIILWSNLWRLSLEIPLTVSGPGYYFSTFWNLSNEGSVGNALWKFPSSMYNTYMVRKGTQFILINKGPETGDIVNNSLLFIVVVLIALLWLFLVETLIEKRRHKKYTAKNTCKILENKKIANLDSGKEYISNCEGKYKRFFTGDSWPNSSFMLAFILEKHLFTTKIFCCKIAK